MNDLRSSNNPASAATTRSASVLPALLAALIALLWFGLTSEPASAANPAAGIEQCRNGAFADPNQCSGSAWQTGNAGASNSHYREGDSVPFRSVLTNLAVSGTHSLVIQYDTIDNGAHAYDYLTSYDRTEATADPCSGISPCVAGTPGSIPADPAIAFENPASVQVAGSISIWNGSITGVAYGSADPAGKRSVVVSFTATSSTVVLAWGGHIASQIDWGAGNSAGAISGSPYHMRLLALDGDGLGNMDRSLSAASVAPVPATFSTQVSSASIVLGQAVTDLATLAGPNGTVSGNVAFFVCGPSLVANPDCSTGGSAVGTVVLGGGQATSAPYTAAQPGRYCFRAEYTPDLFAQYSPRHHTNLTTECFEAVQALGTLRVIKQVVNDAGGTKVAADFSLHVKSGASDVTGSPAAGSSTGTVYTLVAGSYTVSEAAPPAGYAQTGISGDCDASGVVSVVAGMEKTCTITNGDQAAKLVVVKHVVNDEAGDKSAGDFTMTVTGSAPSPASFAGVESPGTEVSLHPGSYSVSEAGPDGYAASFSTGCTGSIALGETKTCTVTNDDVDVPSSIAVTKTAAPLSLPEPGGTATFSVTVQNTSAVDAVTISSLSDDVYGNLDGKGTCDVPQTLVAGASYSCSFSGAVSGSAGSSHVDVVTAAGTDDDGNPVSGSDDATVTVTAGPPPPPPPPPTPPTPPAPPVVPVVAPAAPVIDLSITKTDRPDPVFVGARLVYTLTVGNGGPDLATNVHVVDTIPAATTFLSVTTTQGNCTGGRVIRCNLGSVGVGGRAVVTIVVRPTQPGALINTATVVGDEPEPNTANNRASTPTLVRGPFRPPAAACPTLTVQQRSISVGKRGVIRAAVTEKGRGVRGVRILVEGPGLRKAALTDARGRVAISVRPPRAGIAEVRMTNRPARCSTRRIGVVGVFEPPSVTG